MAGLGILQTGARSRDPRLIRTGLRALNATTRRADVWFASAPFKVFAVAEAYILANKRLRGHKGVRGALAQWGWWLRQQKSTYLYLPHRERYANKYLVDALAILATQATGLTSSVPGTLLGPGRAAARQRAVGLVNRGIPALASQFVLSDPDSNPIAYHALSYGMYARANVLLGRRASRQNARVLRELGRTVQQIAAPDGDISYWGRSMEQKWTLSAAAYGLAVTARLPGTRHAARRRYHAQADRLLRRLATYGVGPRGEWLTPSLRQSFRSGRRSLDSYARATEYTGLALVNLNWAIPRLPRRPPARDLLTTRRSARAVVNQGSGRFATVRAGKLWYAVRERAGGELRYDFGVTAFKRLQSGVWRDVIPLRPVGFGSAGPVLHTKRGGSAPQGRVIRAHADGSVRIHGGFRYRTGGWARRNVDFVVQPDRDRNCLVTAVHAAREDRFTFSVFFRGFRPPTRKQRTLRGPDGQSVTFNAPITSSSSGPRRSSASDAHLTQNRVTVLSPTRHWVTMTQC